MVRDKRRIHALGLFECCKSILILLEMDIKATGRYYDRFASQAKKDDNREQLLKESITHASQKMQIKM